MTNVLFKKTLLSMMALGAFAAFSLPASAKVIPDASKTATYAGYVNTNGSIAAGTGFSVTHTGTGTYTVTYPSAKFPGGYPAMTLSGWGINGSNPIVNLIFTSCGSGSCVFDIVTTSSAGVAQDNGFVFTIVQAK